MRRHRADGRGAASSRLQGDSSDAARGAALFGEGMNTMDEDDVDPGATSGRRESASARRARIAQLEERLRRLRAREQAVEARRRVLESRRARRADTRRKILVGAIVLAKVEQGELPRERLRAWLDSALTRVDDRALFGL